MNDINKMRHLAGMPPLAEKPTKLNEHVVGDLQNGYDRQHKDTKNYSDRFPTGNDYSVTKHSGPSSAEHGDNPMQKAVKDNKKDDVVEENIHTELVYAYRDFLAESE